MYSLNRIRYGNSHFPIYFFPTFLFGMILFIASCKSRPEPYSILEFTGDDAVFNYSKTAYNFSHESDSVNPTALLAGNGDLILFGDNFLYYRQPSQNKFQLKSTKMEGYANGEITTIKLPFNDDLKVWFDKMKTTGLAALDFIKIDSLIPESYFPYLTGLAEIKPDIGLFYEGELIDIAPLFKIFNPRCIIAGTISGKDYNILSVLSNLELLAVSLVDSVNTIPLPAMPKLKQLFLTGVNKKVVLNDKFLTENKQLERLIIITSGRIDFSLLNPLSNLKELIISDFDSVSNFDLIKNQTHLEVLSVTGNNSKYEPVLNDLRGIRWMTFSSNITQDEFNSFIENHPGLEVAEIVKNDTIKSLQSLLMLKNLYGLTITDTLTDLSTVKSLKYLKYLSLPSDVLKDSSRKAELQKALPDTRIVANEGFCLGSGWLLLMIPLIVFFSIVARGKLHKDQNYF